MHAVTLPGLTTDITDMADTNGSDSQPSPPSEDALTTADISLSNGGPRGGRAWSMRNWPILWKLLAMVAVILALTTALVLSLISRAGDEAETVDRLAFQEVGGLGRVLNIDRDAYQAALGLAHAAAAVDPTERDRWLAFYDENIEQTGSRLDAYLGIDRLQAERRAVAEQAARSRAALVDAGGAARGLISRSADPSSIRAALSRMQSALDDFRVPIDELEQSHDAQSSGLGSQVKADIESTRRWAWLGLFAVVVLGSLLAWYITRQITRPLVVAVRKTERLARGDLTVGQIDHDGSTEITRRDEVGRLVRSFNLMLEDFRVLLGRIRSVSDDVADNAGEIASVAHESASAVVELDAAIEQIAQAAQQQAQRSQEVAGVVGEISQATAEVSSAAVALATSSQSSVQVAREGSETVEHALQGIREAGERVGQTARTVEALEEHSGRIESIVETILEIAGQTNLLAINASIVAARAGEEGRAFGVVAGEIRKLAERASAAAAQISDLVGNIRSGVAGSVHAMRDEVGQVEAAVREAGRSAEALQRIVASLEATNEQAQAISGRARNIDVAVSRGRAAVEDLASGAEEEAATAEEMAAQSSQVGAAVRRLVTEDGADGNGKVASVQALERTALDLKELLGRFRF
ncbi:MAG: methyl-accepting chemotaxis protein [Gemmatimonadota bacterium]